MIKTKSLIGERRSAAGKDPRTSYQNRRQEISEAAVKVFHRLGYTAASVSAVAAELGIDRASLYYYFSSKEQMFDEIIRSVLEENVELARRIAQSSMSPTRKMRELIMALMTSYAANYPLLYIYIREDLKNVSDERSSWSAHMRGLNKSIEQSVIDIVEQGYADCSFRKVGTPKVVAYGVLGMLNWTHRWYKPGHSETGEDPGTTFAEMIVSGLESPY
ncbi:TetR/AcrR family transcriptional regulator [Novosphingobium sp.]|uniref:TetR/AcrR family transcriptional regulator n=1 Tax=Novosphingobium sp. TaxID=1874826 RepID=UPI002604C859|nr:TetR/AcrR family transcriptional regulator [Novosphingobium sp.]